jgi:hypothetical protein
MKTWKRNFLQMIETEQAFNAVVGEDTDPGYQLRFKTMCNTAWPYFADAAFSF